ncbi:MAG TPA: anaerobic ribonucleoside-triphosphate reductase activating protein [bacterium]|nr:anaerobic ribonucleoside-triphosphate reductase activating protein [bacterium]
MLIGGLQKTSLLDYPDKISAVIFTVGCNFRCGFCYNSDLVTHAKQAKIIPEEEVLAFLSVRKKKLDAVVITGGEPTLQADLLKFIQKIKALGYLVKLDTNGTNPDRLTQLIKRRLIDYLAMDVKASLPNYTKVVNVKVSPADIKKSIKTIMDSGLPYEFRSTLLPALHSREEVLAMSELISGASRYFLQKFFPTDSLNDQNFRSLKSFTDREMAELAKICLVNVKECFVR